MATRKTNSKTTTQAKSPAKAAETKASAAGVNTAAAKSAASVSATSKEAALSTSQATKSISREQIAQRAYEIWLKKGRPANSEAENWLQAERELGCNC